MRVMSESKAVAVRPRRQIAYEDAGPARLARMPARAPARNADAASSWPIVKRHAEARLNLLRSWRTSWMQHYALLETYILPRRGIFINTAQPTPGAMVGYCTLHNWHMNTAKHKAIFWLIVYNSPNRVLMKRKSKRP